MKTKILNYVNEVKLELSKVTWPARQILKMTTLVITIFMAIIAVYVGLIDVVFAKLMSIFLR